MVTDWVLDASIGVKALVEEPDTATAMQRLDEILLSGRLLAPHLLRYEMGNAVGRKWKGPDLDYALDVALSSVDCLEPRHVARVADGLSYYDASYLALAIEQKAGLLTADEKIRKAAKKHGVPVGP